MHDDLHTLPAATRVGAMSTPLLPLAMLPPGETAEVAEIRGAGRGPARRLTTMGLVPGVRVSVLGRGCPLLVRVGECRIGLGRGLAHRVMVRPC